MSSCDADPTTQPARFAANQTSLLCRAFIAGVLSRLESAGSIESFKVDLESQDVVVKPGAQGLGFDEVKEKVAKTGKEILSGEVVGA